MEYKKVLIKKYVLKVRKKCIFLNFVLVWNSIGIDLVSGR